MRCAHEYDQEIDRGLSADLAALRVTLQELHAPGADERTLIAALRMRRAAAGALDVPPDRLAAGLEPSTRRVRTHGARSRPRLRSPQSRWCSRCASSWVAMVAPADSPASQAAPPAAPAPAFAGAFQPLAFSPGLSASQSYSVVRVRIPLTALAPGHAAPPDATIEADLLVGEDGLASAYSFQQGDTLFVSTASNEIGEGR